MKAGIRILVALNLILALFVVPVAASATGEVEPAPLAGAGIQVQANDKEDKGNSGSIWTRRGDGSGEPGDGKGNNANQYAPQDTILLFGENLGSDADHVYRVTRITPKPDTEVAHGDFKTNEQGDFGGIPITPPTEGWEAGEYMVEVRDGQGKKVASDNFRISGASGPSEGVEDPGEQENPGGSGDPENPSDPGGQEGAGDTGDQEDPGKPRRSAGP